MKREFVVPVMLIVLATAGRPQAADWGNLSGRFLYEGDAPPPKKMEITKDLEYCGKFQDEIVEQSLLVGEGAGLSNVFIWLKPASGKKVDIHPELAKEVAANPAVIDNLHCMFYPHALGMWAKKQSLVVKNSDSVAQVVKIDLVKNSPVNSTIAIGGSTEHKFQAAERLPAKVTCGIHPWENAYLLVSETPYFAVSDKTGEFAIRNLPAGNWEFQVWHEQSGYLAADPKWKSGRFTMPIKAGDNTLGTIKVPAGLLKGDKK